MDFTNNISNEVFLTSYGENLSIQCVRKKDDINSNKILQKFHVQSLMSLFKNGTLNGLKSNLNQIVTLDFSECGLDELPQVLNIPNLKHFVLAKNNLKQVPVCLYSGKLNKLENLDLSYNFITQFDTEPDCVLYLKKLNLKCNCFENVPAWFLAFRCTNLEELNYSENQAKHYNYLKNNMSLTYMKISKLNLQNACLIDKDFGLLKSFRYLESLDVSNQSDLRDVKNINKFREINDLFINVLWERIKVLNLAFLNISFFPEDILWLESLKELYLNNNILSWISEGLRFLINLEILDISNNGLLVLSSEIVHLKKLKVLKAPDNNLEDIPALPVSLETLDLYNNLLEDVSDIYISSLKCIDLELNCVDLSNCDEYKLKRDFYRSLHCYEYRNRGIKTKNYISWSCSEHSKDLSDTESEGSDLSDTSPQSFYAPDEENWDNESIKSKVECFTDITPSDNEWDGDGNVEKIFCDKKPLIQSDEDFVFVDAD